MPEAPTDRQLISKRLHVSGLTPAISSHDLSRRLGSFGSVTALDGLSKLDALGQPRNFTYVTLETTKAQLSRCMNVLSGSTWKGAKLRIGEAKPDFRERILLENASSSVEGDGRRARKRRRLARGVGAVQGRHSQDMSLVTPENVQHRSQWRVTPLGRLIRPMRMRPARPLGLPLNVLNSAANQRGQQGKGRKRRARAAPPTRARRQTIDPLRWGSTHVGGVFLDGGQASTALVASGARGGGGVSTNGESTEIEADDEVEGILDTAAQSPADDNDDPRAVSAGPSSSVPLELASTDFAAERTRTLQLLNSMFGEANEDWGSAESIASDIEQVATESRANVVPYVPQSAHDATADFEVVPADQRRADEKLSVDRQAQTATTAQRNPDPGPVHRPSTSKLKDLFAPREEEGFSLIGHLALDSELDLDLDEPAFANNVPATATIPNTTTATSAISPPAPARTQQAKALDASLPFFFPQSSHAKGPVFKVKFRRTEDEAQIRERWESARGELTREWKRRHREAVKSRRRRGAGGIERE